MPKLFEVFGYRLTDRSEEAEKHRRAALCPFMGRDCDGGGNRYSSTVFLAKRPELRRIFGERSEVPAGVCSLQLRPGGPPWIVCPRRLLVLGVRQDDESGYQRAIKDRLLALLDYPPDTRLGVWSEVRLECEDDVNGVRKKFNYTFDYILVPVGSVLASCVKALTGLHWKIAAEKGGYEVNVGKGEPYLLDFPIGTPSVVEVMTSSTSGGNQRKRTRISLAFEDALLKGEHTAPGINYRQVWARMVSQLVVKSEVALSWGGKAIWVLQDTLVEYISQATGLDIHALRSATTSEVNVLSFSYGTKYLDDNHGVIELEHGELYAGPISAAGPGAVCPAFDDLLRAPVLPSRQQLFAALAKTTKDRRGIMVVPRL